jgi:site-specific DNA-methyltransferase (adenine-specific)
MNTKNIKLKFDEMKVNELKKYCKENGIKHISGLKKQDIINKIKCAIEQDTDDTEDTEVDEYETENIKLYKGDCLDKLNKIDDKSVQLICIDPPYNIGKDSWDKIDNYIEFMIDVIKKLETKLRDNGSFFMFHNDMETISELMVNIKKNTKFVFKQMIVWNKRFENSPKKGFMDGYVVKNDMHNFNKMAEYILFYTFDNSYKLKEKRNELNISQLDISKEILSKTGGLTGWYSNLETGKNMPTRQTIKPIEKYLGLKYEEITPKFNNQKTHHSVWNYDMAKRCPVHITPKPIDLLKNIIFHTTDKNDTVLDCFAGSGSMAYACNETERKCILIEKCDKYFNYIVNKLDTTK